MIKRNELAILQLSAAQEIRELLAGFYQSFDGSEQVKEVEDGISPDVLGEEERYVEHDQFSVW